MHWRFQSPIHEKIQLGMEWPGLEGAVRPCMLFSPCESHNDCGFKGECTNLPLFGEKCVCNVNDEKPVDVIPDVVIPDRSGESLLPPTDSVDGGPSIAKCKWGMTCNSHSDCMNDMCLPKT